MQSNNYHFSYFNDLHQSGNKVVILANFEILIPLFQFQCRIYFTLTIHFVLALSKIRNRSLRNEEKYFFLWIIVNQTRNLPTTWYVIIHATFIIQNSILWCRLSQLKGYKSYNNVSLIGGKLLLTLQRRRLSNRNCRSGNKKLCSSYVL